MRTFYEWVQTRPRNEALDCFNYALAALKMLDVDWDKLDNQANQNKPAALQETAPVVATKPAKKPNPFIKNEDW
jgi:phage terminase large subunit GpA-like protein